MLHELEDQVAAGSGELSRAKFNRADEDTALRREHLSRPAKGSGEGVGDVEDCA